MKFTPLIGPLGESRAITTAGGGTALTSAATFIQMPPATEAVQLIARNFATAVAVQVAFTPWLTVLKTTDGFADPANVTDYTDAAQDASTGTTIVLSSLPTTGALWVGASVPFRGVSVDVNAPNTAASTLTGTYWNGTTMTDISLSDGTASGSATFAIDGVVTWTVPTAWIKSSLASIAAAPVGVRGRNTDLYWVKLVASGAMDSSATLNSLLAIGRGPYHELVAEAPEIAIVVNRGEDGSGAIEAKCDAGTANIVINAMTSRRFV